MKKRAASISIAVACAAVLMSAQMALAGNDGTPSQSEADKTATASTFAGLWGDAPGGTAGRPYVTDLSVTVTPADGSASVSRTFVTGGTVTTPTSTTAGDVTAVISPTNVCNKARGDVPAAGQCYASPNRLGLAVGYVIDQSTVGMNFSNPQASNGQPISTPLLDLMKNPANTTVIDITLNMNSWGHALRWTWMNGKPTFWSVNPVGQDNSVVHAKFVLSTGPSETCDSRIPVVGCDPTQRGGSFAPTAQLRSSMVLSLDDTGVDAVFAGTLFSSVNADMGSLEASPSGSPTLGFTYGIAGVNELGGQTNSAQFNAFVSDASLLNYFGVTQDVLDSDSFATSDTMKVSRADGGSSDAPAWSRWTAAVNGSTGYFLTVSNVHFDGRSVSSLGVRANGLVKTSPAKWTLGKKLSNSVVVKKSGTKQVLTMSSTTTLCKKNLCRWVVSKAASVASTSSKKLGTFATLRGTSKATATVAAAKGNRLAAVLQAQVKGKWTFVTSRLVFGK